MQHTLTLTAEQAAAVAHENGPALVTAGPGSGKTRVVVERMLALIQRQVSPDAILTVTFTNNAADQIRTRVSSQGDVHPSLLHIGTFHSLMALLLRHKYSELLGFTDDFSILDREQADTILRQAIDKTEMGNWRNQKAAYFKAKDEIAAWKNNLVFPGHAPADNPAANVYKVYQELLQQTNSMDYDDLLLQAYRAFYLAKREGTFENMWSHVIVDECQDMNPAQYALLDYLSGEDNNLFLVGDKYQSIYSFHGSDPKLIEKYILDYAPQTYFLTGNFRSTQAVIDVYNYLRDDLKVSCETKIPGTPVRLLTCTNEQEQLQALIRQVVSLHESGVQYSDMAVLYRTHKVGKHLTIALEKAGIACGPLAGNSLMKERVARYVAAYCELLLNPSNYAAVTELLLTNNGELNNRLFPGFGGNAQLITQHLTEHQPRDWGQPYYEAINQGMEALNTLGLYKLVEKLCSRALLLIGEGTELYYQNELSAQSLKRVLGYTMREATSDAEQTDVLRAFLDNLRLLGKKQEGDDGDGIQHGTFHATKGMEFPHVFVLNADSNSMPYVKSKFNKEEEAEEQRLAYVVLSRAQSSLTLFSPSPTYSKFLHTPVKENLIELN